MSDSNRKNRITNLDEQIQREAKTQIGVTIGATIFIVILGIWFYHKYEGLSILDSWYFVIVTLTTVGYGDISPQTEIGRLVTPLFILSGIGILTSLVTGVNKYIIKRRAEKAERRRKVLSS